jgi:hypothetical protein
MAPFKQRRTTLLSAGASAMVATGLWIVSGFINHSLLVNAGRVPSPVIDLVVPRAMNFRVNSGFLGVGTISALACLLLALVVAGLTALAVFRLRPGQGWMTLFLATWFAAIAGSFAASTVQALGLASELHMLSGTDLLNLLVPSITSGGYWGFALGWLAGLAAVITFALSGGRADTVTATG